MLFTAMLFLVGCSNSEIQQPSLGSCSLYTPYDEVSTKLIYEIYGEDEIEIVKVISQDHMDDQDYFDQDSLKTIETYMTNEKERFENIDGVDFIFEIKQDSEGLDITSSYIFTLKDIEGEIETVVIPNVYQPSWQNMTKQEFYNTKEINHFVCE